MNVEDTLHEINWNYPTQMFGENSKLDVFDHLFLTVGNGYEWVDGELVNKYKDKRNNFEGFIRDIFWYYNLTKELHTAAGMSESKWDEEAAIKEMVEDLDKPFLSFYCASKKYSRCFNVPEDVKQDWLEAIISFLETAVEMDNSYWIDERYAETSDYTKDLAYNSKSKCVKQLSYLKEYFKERL